MHGQQVQLREVARRSARDPDEHRHGGRVASTGSAVVRAGSCSIRARIADLAAGGVQLLVDSAAPALDLGARVQVELRLDGIGCWLHLTGRVTRVEPRASATAVVIEVLRAPPDFEDLVQNELLAALECAQTPHVLLVDPDHRRRARVATGFRGVGCRVIEASSPLEAIRELDESRLHPWAVVVADAETDPRVDALRAFLGDVYPSVPLIVIGGRGRTRSTTSLGVDRIADLASQILGLVRTREGIGVRVQSH